MEPTERTESVRQADCDVLVIGGGPAGSTVAALLAQRGFATRLVEKDKHPRFHIGESLLPLNMPLLQRLGVLERIAAIGMLKPGAEFVSPRHARTTTYYFAKIGGNAFPFAYQVRRSEFDAILFENARAKGAAVDEACRVEAVEFPLGGGAVATGRDAAGAARRWQARFVIDATGRDTLLANQFGIKRRNRQHGTAALYGHFGGARRLSGRDTGNISIFWFPHGWFWFIPLADGTTSVGAVCNPTYLKTRRGALEGFFLETIALCPQLAERLSAAKLLTPVTGTGNYSYAATAMTGASHLLLGDAFAFIDPVFSTGVYIAMSSAFRAADAVAASLETPARQAAALARYEVETRYALRAFAWFIYRITMPAMCRLFMAPRNILGMEQAMLRMLAGNVATATSWRARIWLFKLLYYAASLSMPRASWRGWLERRRGTAAASDKATLDGMAAPRV